MTIITQENIYKIKTRKDFKEKLYGFLQQDSLEVLYKILIKELGKDIIIDLKDLYDSVFVTRIPIDDIPCIKTKTKYGRTVHVLYKYIEHVRSSQEDYKRTLNSMRLTTV